MNRKKRNAPKPKRFCTTSSNDETLSQRNNDPQRKMRDAFTKIKMDLKKRQIANNLTQERQTSRTNSMDDFRRKKFTQTCRTDIMDDSRQQTTRVRSSSHLQTASLHTKQRDDTNSSLLLKRQMPNVQTPTSSQTATRQLNSPSDLQSKNDQSNTFDPNAHFTIGSQYSTMSNPQLLYEQYAQSDISLPTPQKRPLIHSTIPSHVQQQSPNNQSLQSDDITHTSLRRLDVNIPQCRTARASSTKVEELHLQTLM